MATKGKKDQPGHWKGDAVEEQPGDEAERAAERAEGNEPVRSEEESRRLHAPDPHTEPEDLRRRPPRNRDPQAGIADAAEEHQARKQAGERPPRCKL